MSTDSKVLTFPKRPKTVVGGQKAKSSLSASVVDIGQRRQDIINAERRSVRRTILTEFLGVHLIVPGSGLQKCSLVDISEKGLAFDLEKKIGGLKEGERIAMRVYLNHQTYFGFSVEVRSARFISDEACYRHGVSFVEGSMNEDALKHFVRFLETVSASLRTDGGDVLVSNLDIK